MRYSFFILSFFTFFLQGKAQTGWEFIQSNNHIAAKEQFLKTLKKDSTDKSSIQGMIYLAELEEDDFSYIRYVNSLLDNHLEEYTLRLFSDDYKWENLDKILANSQLSIAPKLSASFSKAYELDEGRKFDEARRIINKHVGAYQWAVIGPFENPNGSGHIKKYVVESDTFSLDKSYSNDSYQVRWLLPEYYSWTNDIGFQDYLNSSRQGEVYYANTFLDFKYEGVVDLRISRFMPVKVWLDDCLVYENNNRIGYIWDNEQIRLSISKGIHRVLIKSSDYFPKDDAYDLFHFNDYNEFSSYQSASVVLRVTDTLGNLRTDIQSLPHAHYTPQIYQPQVSSFPISAYFSTQLTQHPDDLFLNYLYCKALQTEGQLLQAEAYFVKKYREHNNIVFYKHLLAKCYAKNGKIERAYEVMNDIDQGKTPLFDLLYEKFAELDMEHDEKEWLEKLEGLNTITPSNYSVISNFINYYDTKGLKDKKEEYIKEMIKKYPHHAYRLTYELEKSNKPQKHFTDKEKLKGVKEAQVSIKKSFYTVDYETLIEHYLDKDNLGKVENLYLELISIRSHLYNYRIDLAEFYYQNERLDDALNQLKTALRTAPYDPVIHELLGDIYYDQKKETIALTSYLNAREYTTSTYLGDLETKIEKIQGQRKLKSLFKTNTFDDLLADSTWVTKYQDKDAVVVMFTRDIAVDSNSRIEVFHRMMIKIQTKIGVDKWTEFNSNFMGSLSTVKVIKSNGSVVRPDVRGTYVVCKNLEPGDLIQLEGHTKNNWKGELGSDIYMFNFFTFTSPIYYAKLEYAMPHKTELVYLQNKLNVSPEVERDSLFIHYKWEFTDLSELVKEEATIDNLDMYAYTMVGSIPDWSKVVQWYQDKTYRLLESTYEVSEILDSIILPDMTNQQKVYAIYNYITTEIKYSYVPFLQSNFIPKRCGLTCAARIGDCKDVATLMITMLQQLDIEAYYVLVKTSHMSSSDIVPSLYFDHVIVGYVLDGEMHYVDLTTDFYPHYVLTDIDVNQVALVVRDGEKEVFRLPADNVNPQKNKIEVVVNAKLNDDRSVDLDIKASYPGMAGGFIRERFSRFTEEEKMNYIIENVGNGIYNHLELEDFNIENLENLQNPLTATYKAKALGFANYFLDYMTFRIPFETAVEYSSVMSSKTRQNGLDIAKITNIVPTHQTIEVEIPKDYALAVLPKPIHITTEFGEYTMTFKKTAKGIAIEKYQQFNQQYIRADQFGAFKQFYLQVLDADATLIPLKRLK